MKKLLSRSLAAAAGLAIAVMTVGTASAAIIGVSGPNSSVGTAASIITAPSNVQDDNVFNSGQQGFDEAQGVITSQAFDVYGGSIAAGTRVDSHMIFLNSQGNTAVGHYNVEWTFSGTILGVMADIWGNHEAASSGELGAAATVYDNGVNAESAPFQNRGLEGQYWNANNLNTNDAFLIGGVDNNILTLSMYVTEPGDWIRVVTVSAVPLPAALPLYGAGVAVLGFLGWRRRKAMSA